MKGRKGACRPLKPVQWPRKVMHPVVKRKNVNYPGGPARSHRFRGGPLRAVARRTCRPISRQPHGSLMTRRYLIRDRDTSYGAAVTRRLRAMGIRDRPIMPRSPWQNGHVERLIGSIRRECLDHVVVLGERHLRHLLANYASYYNGVRTHL